MRIVGAVVGVLVVIALGALGVFFQREAIAQGDSLIGSSALLFVPLLCAGVLIVAILAALVPRLRQGHENVKSVMAVAFAAVLGVGVFAVNSDVPVQRPDVTVTGAVARACAGQPVPEAGIVHSDGSVRNHLVVLDATGAEQAWTGKPPIEWRPPTVDEVELVACIDAADARGVEQVCEYTNGSTTTRYSATRTVRVVAARTGIELARFSITDLPSSCSQKKVGDDDTITGYVDWPVVEAHLASFVRDGSFVDPDAVATKEQPDATSESGSEPSEQPSEAIVEARQMTLQAAIKAGVVTAKGVGIGLESLRLRISSKVAEPLRIVVKAGTYLVPGKAATQTMVVIESTTVDLGAKATATETLDVACSQMHDDQPGGSDTFTVRARLATGALGKLLAGDAFGAARFRIQQFAIWTITSNPTRSGYVALGSFGVGRGPSAAEIRQIRTIFRDAGIDPSAYRALK